MVFVDTPWKAYVQGDDNAISAGAKQGALLFFGDTAEQGLACAECHGGDFFTDERLTAAGFPQTGPGKGDGATADADFGREQQTANSQDRFLFRTPTLLNLSATAPYTHTGSYSLDAAIAHYFIPEAIFDDELPGGSVCRLAQFANHPDCAALFPNTVAHSQDTLAAAVEMRIIDPTQTFADLSFSPPSDGPPLTAFLNILTDPCTLDRDCLSPWIPLPDEAPDENQLNAVDIDGNPL